MTRDEAIRWFTDTRAGGLALGDKQVAEASDMAITALQEKEKFRWIPVTERLPEHSDGHVLVTDGEQVKISCRNACYKTASGELRCAQGYGSGMPVTHWMPLPEPPKEEEK